MSGASPETRDKISWSGSGGAPSGTVAKKISEGEAPEVDVEEKKGSRTPKKSAAKKDSKTTDAAKVTPKNSLKETSKDAPKETKSPSKRKREEDHVDGEAPAAKRGRGRPRKGEEATTRPKKEGQEGTRQSVRDMAPPRRLQDEPQPAKAPGKGRGRPKGSTKKTAGSGEPAGPPKKRGRPPGSTNKGTPKPKTIASTTASGKKRGRPPGSTKNTPTAKPAKSGRGRGRPRKTE